MSHLAELAKLLGPGASLISDPDITITYSRDQAPFAESAPPFAVLLARSAQEISIALAYANQNSIPVVTRGAGSGLAGGANSSAGSLVISLEKMAQILEIDEANQIARVQAGVINLDLDKAAQEFGLAYLPDPASRDWSTLGGNAATNAGGMCCVKYGVTGGHVRAIQVVLASGEIIELGKATKKSVTTYDLLHLFIGSEGTLGIITELTLNLEVRPSPAATLIATFPNIVNAATAANALLKYRPSMLEIIDQTTLRAVESWHPLGFEVAGAVLLMQLDENQSQCEAALATCRGFDLIDGVYSDDPADAADLIRVRKLAYPALERMGATLLDDVALPITKIAEFVQQVQILGVENQLTIGIFGHAGDGNMHPTIVHDHGDLAAAERAQKVFGKIVAIAQTLGGTASGEHGIGTIKTSFIANEVSETVIGLQRSVKSIFDPNFILNPGKKFESGVLISSKK
ncbi:MAG: FAD-linked oxidase C-terminal domain-containing protein [Candidatus Planktophila sp.]|jgi:glycolate oxidase|tara:strand:- start:5655 stop:7034 length:1380 start_codon:yes stop_codon:yes gene_type:complete